MRFIYAAAITAAVAAVPAHGQESQQLAPGLWTRGPIEYAAPRGSYPQSTPPASSVKNVVGFCTGSTWVGWNQRATYNPGGDLRQAGRPRRILVSFRGVTEEAWKDGDSICWTRETEPAPGGCCWTVERIDVDEGTGLIIRREAMSANNTNPHAREITSP